MRKQLNSVLFLSALSALVFAVASKPALAEKKGLDGSYVGVGAGVVSGQGSYSTLSINGRVQLGTLPVSLRPSLLYFPDSNDTAFIGTVTYDAGIAKNTNIYVGPGVALNGTNDYSSLALQAGAETAIAKNVVLYGDVTYLTSSGEFPVKVGVGYRF
ncbi:hypothetical protein [Calothrix sp. NIES-3974]|uniref:hypothetical protein n=1 Tax=Calothrix sp. NIES-3974 TaxID=2005462 RepID=UPI000B5E9B5B|nr:hypothetical protein [Calothrix sp. NIES-3974]BAZ04487.1 outer membrane insertion C-terminal signal domain protein [Calothrix sp. NIES-3974]